MYTRLYLAVLLCWLGAQPALAAPRAAVLVGVGKYHPDSVRSRDEPLDLKGPPNDLALMQDLLAHYGFREQDMLVLADEQAGRDAIIQAVADRLLTLPPESIAVFYFSGHGSAVRGVTTDEANDETIVPYDGRIRGERVRDILDDQIHGWITELGRKRIRAVFILDSCLSGGAARPAGLELRRLAPALSSATTPEADRKLNLRDDTGSDQATPVVVVTASTKGENAYGQIDGASGTYRGVFTNALYRLLMPTDSSVQPKTWAGVADALKSRLKPEITGAPKQTPQLFGMPGAPVFGSGQPFSHAIKARPISPGSAELAAGSLTGITPGSVFKLFGPDRIPWRTSIEFEAKARVGRVFDQTATLEVIEGALASDKLYAVEFEYALPGIVLKVGLASGTGFGASDAHALRTALSGIGEIVADRARADLLLTAAGGRLQLTTAAGAPVGTPFELAGASAMSADLRERLGDYVRWQRLLAWKRAAVRPTGLKIALELQAAGGEVTTLQDGMLERVQIPAGASIKLRVRNFGLQRVQAHALLLRQDFTIDACPLGIVERNAPSATESATLASGAGLAGFKLIVSDPEQTVELSYLHSRAVTRAPRSALERELAGLWHGAASTVMRRGAGGATFEWQTVEIPFTVKAAPPDAPREAVRRCANIPQ